MTASNACFCVGPLGACPCILKYRKYYKADITFVRSEQVDIIRRSAERGLKLAQNEDKKFIDIFQHILDELERIK